MSSVFWKLNSTAREQMKYNIKCGQENKNKNKKVQHITVPILKFVSSFLLI